MMDSPTAQAAPIVVVTGLPRSGTSMMMRMLEAGGVPLLVDGVRKADLDNPNGYYEYEPVKLLKQNSSWVAGASGKAVKMVYLLVHDLPPSLPYNVIFMRRVLEEIVASQDEMLRRSGTQVSPDESRQLIGLFRDELRAFEAWLALDPFNNPNAPPGPLFMPQYKLSLDEQANQLDIQAEKTFKQGQAANQQSDDYVLNAVFFATVLFLTAIAQRFEWKTLRALILAIALGMLLFGVYHLITYPIN